MSRGLSLVLFLALAGISALHVYWAFGGFWPGKDPESLRRAVVGMKTMRTMPSRALTLLVALLLFAAALLPLVRAALLPLALPPLLVQLAVAGLAGVFALRGVASYTQSWRRAHDEEPFASLDRRLYAPLCLSLGAGFATLLLF